MIINESCRDFVSLSSSTNKSILTLNKKYNLSIQDFHYLKSILIPLFDLLVFHSKKELDYIDWKTVLNLKEKGIHYTESGLEVIKLILSQMNSKRLSTYTVGKPVDRLILQDKIDKFLNGPSNYELKEDGKIWIKSLNKYHLNRKNAVVQLLDEKGLVVNVFDTMASCAKFLGINPTSVRYRLIRGKAVLFNNKLFYIRLVRKS